jgi:hypothetical protein
MEMTEVQGFRAKLNADPALQEQFLEAYTRGDRAVVELGHDNGFEFSVMDLQDEMVRPRPNGLTPFEAKVAEMLERKLVDELSHSTLEMPSGDEARRIFVQLPELLWNRGVAALCDWRVPDEFPPGSMYTPCPYARGNLTLQGRADLISDLSQFRNIQDGDLVWVRLAWLGSFIAQVLPLTKARFVLVTGDSDNSVPSDIMRYAGEVLWHRNVTRWFTQNCDLSSLTDQIRPLPIGIDFHTLRERPFWGEPACSPGEQEQKLKATAQSFKPVEWRIPDVYVDFAWRPTHYGDRSRIVSTLSSNPRVVCQGTFLPRTEMWRKRGEFAFVVSPHGVGLDCHRTWEALALGHIVIVPRSPLESLFAELGVVSIDSWNDITPSNLETWIHEYSPLTRNPERLRSRWWVNMMR